LGIVHTVAHCFNYLHLSQATDLAAVNSAFGTNFISAPTQADLHGTRTGVTGWILVFLLLLLVAFAVEKVRRTNFKLFFSVHHLYIPIIACLCIHDHWVDPVEVVYWMIPVIVVFLTERALTVYRGVPEYSAFWGTKALQGDVLALVFDKPPWFKYSAGHYVWINCPAVSLVEWHPFTLTSSPDEDYLMVDINAAGDWTKKIFALYAKYLINPPSLKEKDPDTNVIVMDEFPPSRTGSEYTVASSSDILPSARNKYLPRLRIDGPYGTASGDVLLYTHVILIGGGIGVTPFISILKSIRYAVLYTNNCPLHAVHFIWVTKTQANFLWFSMMLADLERHEDLRGFLRISIYFTGIPMVSRDANSSGRDCLT